MHYLGRSTQQIVRRKPMLNGDEVEDIGISSLKHLAIVHFRTNQRTSPLPQFSHLFGDENKSGHTWHTSLPENIHPSAGWKSRSRDKTRRAGLDFSFVQPTQGFVGYPSIEQVVICSVRSVVVRQSEAKHEVNTYFG